ncbi:S8 family peptidase [Clostridium sp. LP20]|uniref:S8 family peptidase n=1 Tax=Clostridium sp. LP20 TaxID=3418665 RepID=UPI003EE45140
MFRSNKCNDYYYSENSPNYLIEYRGNFKEEIDKIDYACGDVITERLGVVSISNENVNRLINDVPSIVFFEPRSQYVLQDVSPTNIDEIYKVKENPYLNLTGRGILVGLVDTGIDYLNEEFMREDGTTRILSIWDQTIIAEKGKSVYIGDIFTGEDIGRAIDISKNGGDPYSVVPTKDDVGHGTKMASIIGARGFNKDIKGIAPDCEFVVVKALESLSYKKIMRENGLEVKPVYNASEILAGIEYLKRYALILEKPIVICLGVGTTEGSHDGNNLVSRYITDIGRMRGIITVVGTGNQGAAEGHASGYIKDTGDIKTIELNIPKRMAELSFTVWARRPNKMAINVISPTGESSGFIPPKIRGMEERKFVFTNTVLKIYHFIPEHFTGNQSIIIGLINLSPGIWKIQLRGDYIVNGRYDIWLPAKEILPEGTVFLEPDPNITLTIPSTARKVVTVAYYNSEKGSGSVESGRGFNTNNLVSPDITTSGINILTTKPYGGVTTFSGSSAATAVASGVCCLLLQWGITDKNDLTMYSVTLRSYLMYGAKRRREFIYPNREVGYGLLDLLGVFNFIGGLYEQLSRSNNNRYNEYYTGGLFIRIPIVEGEVKGGKG